MCYTEKEYASSDIVTIAHNLSGRNQMQMAKRQFSIKRAAFLIFRIRVSGRIKLRLVKT